MIPSIRSPARTHSGRIRFATDMDTRCPTSPQVHPGTPTGSFADLWVRSRLRRRAQGHYVLPANHESSTKYPLLFVHDGGDYLTYGSMALVLDNLIHRQVIPPLLAAFSWPGDRLHEYSANDGQARFRRRGSLPHIEKDYRRAPRWSWERVWVQSPRSTPLGETQTCSTDFSSNRAPLPRLEDGDRRSTCSVRLPTFSTVCSRRLAPASGLYLLWNLREDDWREPLYVSSPGAGRACGQILGEPRRAHLGSMARSARRRIGLGGAPEMKEFGVVADQNPGPATLMPITLAGSRM